MKKILIIISVLIINFNAVGQKKLNNCLNKISLEPSFIAITTHKNSKLGEWYKNTFGLEIVKEFAFFNGITTGVLMKKDEFIDRCCVKNKNVYDISPLSLV